MTRKTKTLLLGSLLVGSLATSALPVMARDFWHWHDSEHRWERRAERSDERDLAQARRQLEYDREHHAIRRKIAEGEARVRDIERDLKDELREHHHDD
jgi:hypothetical protein